MKPKKNNQKPEMKTSLHQRISLRTVVIVSSGIFAMGALALIIANMSNPFSSQAQTDNSIEIVKVSEQVFTNETTLEQPVLIQQKINGEHTILIRDKKVINAQ